MSAFLFQAFQTTLIFLLNHHVFSPDVMQSEKNSGISMGIPVLKLFENEITAGN